MVPGNELPAQRQAELEERERANAALILDEEIDRRVMHIIEDNEAYLICLVENVILRRIVYDQRFHRQILDIVQRHALKDRIKL